MNPSKKLTIQECEVDDKSVTITKKEYATGRNGKVSYAYQRVERQVVMQPQAHTLGTEPAVSALESENTSTTIDNCVDALEQVQKRIQDTRRANQHFVRKAISQDSIPKSATNSQNSAQVIEHEQVVEHKEALPLRNEVLFHDSKEVVPQEVVTYPLTENKQQVSEEVEVTNPCYMDPSEIINQHLQAQRELANKANSQSNYLEVDSTSQFTPENIPNLEKSFFQTDSMLESPEAQTDMATKKSNNPENVQQDELKTTQVEVEIETASIQEQSMQEEVVEQTTETDVAQEATVDAPEEIVIDVPVSQIQEAQVVEPEPTPFELFVAKLNARDNLRNVISALEELKTSVVDGLDLTLPENAEYIQALVTFIKEVVTANQDILTFDNAKKQETISRVKVLVEERRKVVERLTREYDSSKQFANEKPVKDVIKPLFQNFATALDRFPKKDTTEDFEAFKIKLRGFEEKLRVDLENFGIVIFGQSGDAFDPTRHDAVAQYPAQTPEQANTLAYVSAQGYELNGRVVSPATVITYGDFEG